MRKRAFTAFSVRLSLRCMNLRTAIRRGCNGHRIRLYPRKQIGVYGLVSNTFVSRREPLPISINVRLSEKIESVGSFTEKLGLIADIKPDSDYPSLHCCGSRRRICESVRYSGWVHVDFNRRITNAQCESFQRFHLGDHRNILFRANKVLICTAGRRQYHQVCKISNMRNRQCPLILDNKICSKRGFCVQSTAGRNSDFRTI